MLSVKPMKVIQITMDADLAAQVDECAQRVGATRASFTREALRAALRRYRIKDLEERHRDGYRRIPTKPHELKVADGDHAWGNRWQEQSASPSR